MNMVVFWVVAACLVIFFMRGVILGVGGGGN
jgi:hypothetical protein